MNAQDASADRRAGDIAIVGMALRVPGAQDVQVFWDNLAAGRESILRLDEAQLRAAGERPEAMADPDYVPAAAPLEGFDMFDAGVFGFGPRDAAILDPQHRKFLEVCWEAMEQAGHAPGTGARDVGVFGGCGMGSYFYFNICSNPDLVEDVGMFLLRHTGNDKDFLTTRVSHVLDLKGPSVSVQTACSTSLVAVLEACAALRRGDCGMALAGGSTIELPQGRGYRCRENEILSPDGHCHAFDHRARGTVFGSGAGAVCLRRLEDAIADGDHVWAVIRGGAVNNDGAAKAGYLAPSVDGQAAAVVRAIEAAGVTADTLGYVECHGTGTFLGDPIEVAALTQAFRQSTDRTGYCRIGSVKTNIGHLDTAAGVASLIKASLALHHKQIPPSLGYEAPNPAIDFETSPFRVSDRLADWPAGAAPRRAGVNALGVGGTNAHVVLEEAPLRPAPEASDWPFQVLCLSGNGKPALEDNARALAAHLRDHPEQMLADVAHTLKQGRHAFDHRRVLVAETHEEAAALLEEGDPCRVFTHERLGDDPDVVFMFPGGGAQHAGMARDLYETEPVFAEWMDRGLDHLTARLGHDIRATWLPAPDDSAAAEARLRQPSMQLPLLMIVEYALAKLWMSWGIRPAALIGHSMGENTAAALAGVMGFEDCIDLVLLRGRLFDGVAPGGMLSVALPVAEVEALVGGDLDIASVNAPGLCAVSGPREALGRFEERLVARGVECQRIPIDIAAHSRMLDPILPEFRAFLRGLDLQVPQIPFVSNQTGDWITAEQATDPDYWAGQLRYCVQFADGMARLAERRDRVFFEVGPGRALTSLARMAPGVRAGQVIAALRHPRDAVPDDRYLMEVVGRFWACGVEADWAQIWGAARRGRVVLPTYRFQSRRHFIEPGKARPAAEGGLPDRAGDIADWGYRPVWQPRCAACPVDRFDRLGTDAPTTWLFFADDDGLADRLAARLSGAGHRVSLVRAGDSFTRLGTGDYRLAPEQGAEGYAALLADLAAEGRLPDRIVHGWLLTREERFRPGSDFFTRNVEQGFQSLLHLAQALESVDRPEKLHVTVLTSGAAQLRDEPLPYPEKAMIAGPVGTIPKELPGVTVTQLDIEPPGRAARRGPLTRLIGGAPDRQGWELTDRLLEELLADPSSDTAALRGGRRYEQIWAKAPLPEAGAAGTPGFRAGGTWLITGGLGGMGLALARDLAATGRANIVLVARTGLPSRAEWDACLSAAPETNETARRIRAVRQIEAAGGTVRVEAADICDMEAMRAVVDRASAAFGRIDGVIHAAGVIDDAPLLGKGLEDVERVLAPKVHGLRVLDTLFPDGALDLMVLASSTSTITRPEGQIDYVAANEFLNAYAKSRKGGKTRVVAIDWGVWSTVGMAARAVARPGGAGSGEAGPDKAGPDEADAGLARARVADLPLLQEVAQGARGEWRGRLALDARAHWVMDEHRTRDGAALLPGTGFLELAVETHLAAGGALPVALRDVAFLRPLGAGDAAPREVETRLALSGAAMRFETRGLCTVDGRQGTVLHAEATLAPLAAEAPPPVDPDDIARRCPAPSAHIGKSGFVSPQEAHLDFGPRWRVVSAARLGAGEGLARLALPTAYRDDLAAGYLLHPALMDLATGWAMELIGGYRPDRLWVPVSYEAIEVYHKLPAEIVSHVRLRPETDGAAGMAGFDVTLAAPDGMVLVEVKNFHMQRLAEGAVLSGATAPAPAEIEVEAGDTAPAASVDARLQRMVALGIRPEEGAEALRRALARGAPQIALSPLDLDRLTALADRPAARPGAQSFDRPDIDADHVAPSTALEADLARLWEEVLGVKGIGIEDSFFDLGGHSLLAVRLFAAVRRAHGVRFPISVLLEAPTIAALARRIEERGGGAANAQEAPNAAQAAPAERLAVPLNEADQAGKRPFFIVAGMFGNVLNLRHLALQLGNRPVYGLQARGLIGDAAPHDSIAAAAADYIDEIRALQPEGPYLLGGFSGGGITALEIARQLGAEGQAVAQLVLLDTLLPVRPAPSLTDKALMKVQDLRREGPRYLLKWVADRWAWERRRLVRAEAAEPSQGRGAFNNHRIGQAHLDAVAAYRLRPAAVPTVLFRPPLDRHWKGAGGRWISRKREYVTEDNGWSPWIADLTVIEVPGDHDSMVLMPNVRVLARHLQGLFEECDRGPAPNLPTHSGAARVAAE